ncbi:MAG: type II toxin-antitoxin system prevent-host-death family antitoxin, partial [Candidatus Levyibacteriota bacterium]
LTMLYIVLYTALNMSTLISISDAREQLPNLVSRVSKYMDRVVITVKGQPKATLVSAEELESLEETAEVLAIPNIKRDLEKSKKEAKLGKLIPLEDVIKGL